MNDISTIIYKKVEQMILGAVPLWHLEVIKRFPILRSLFGWEIETHLLDGNGYEEVIVKRYGKEIDKVIFKFEGVKK